MVPKPVFKKAFKTYEVTTFSKHDNSTLQIHDAPTLKKADKTNEISTFLSFLRSEVQCPKNIVPSLYKQLLLKPMKYQYFQNTTTQVQNMTAQYSKYIIHALFKKAYKTNEITIFM